MRRLLAACAICAILGGCVSGTEVGNPEVSAQVDLILPAGWDMSYFNILVAGLSYRAGSDSGALWSGSGTNALNVADSTANALSPQRVNTVAWNTATMNFAFGASTFIPNDTTSWGQVHDPGWAAFAENYGTGATQKFLFALPDSLQIRVTFDVATLRASQSDDSLNLKVWFDCRQWAAVLDSSDLDSLVLRPGGADGPFAVLSPGENTGIYVRLLAAIPKAFTTINGL